MQDALKQLHDQKTIPFAHFKQLCIKAGVDHAEWFVGYLHKTGIVLPCRRISRIRSSSRSELGD
ncbi:MAG: hypothetical protein R3E89_15220 [Thiolinea sp.]